MLISHNNIVHINYKIVDIFSLFNKSLLHHYISEQGFAIVTEFTGNRKSFNSTIRSRVCLAITLWLCVNLRIKDIYRKDYGDCSLLCTTARCGLVFSRCYSSPTKKITLLD